MPKYSREERKAYYSEHPYTVVKGSNGYNAVDPKTVRNDILNFSDGNEKVGRVGCFNLPVAYSCVHDCECYLNGDCYACGGCYNFASRQAMYSENFAFIMSHSIAEFVDTVVNEIGYRGWTLFRWFTCGDILSVSMFDGMVQIARQCPTVTFWLYTKKYRMVNTWVSAHGEEALPGNLTIIFSHWRNKDGSFYPMPNPYNFPTSEFIPMGCEDEVQYVTHVCPCSDPDVVSTCETCEHPCFKLKKGEKMALLEHSTKATKERDKALKEAKKALKKAKKSA